MSVLVVLRVAAVARTGTVASSSLGVLVGALTVATASARFIGAVHIVVVVTSAIVLLFTFIFCGWFAHGEAIKQGTGKKQSKIAEVEEPVSTAVALLEYVLVVHVLGMAGVLIIHLVPVNRRIKIYPIHCIRGEREMS